jgi:hypothetical protein
MIKKFPKNAVSVYKMQNLMLVSVEKVKVSDLYLLLGEIFCIFFNVFELAFHDTQTELCKNYFLLFANIQAKRGRTA